MISIPIPEEVERLVKRMVILESELEAANSRIKELESTLELALTHDTQGKAMNDFRKLAATMPATVPISDVNPLLDACEDILAEGRCHSGYCGCPQCDAFTALNKALPAFYTKHPELEEQ